MFFENFFLLSCFFSLTDSARSLKELPDDIIDGMSRQFNLTFALSSLNQKFRSQLRPNRKSLAMSRLQAACNGTAEFYSSAPLSMFHYPVPSTLCYIGLVRFSHSGETVSSRLRYTLENPIFKDLTQLNLAIPVMSKMIDQGTFSMNHVQSALRRDESSVMHTMLSKSKITKVYLTPNNQIIVFPNHINHAVIHLYDSQAISFHNILATVFKLDKKLNRLSACTSMPSGRTRFTRFPSVVNAFHKRLLTIFSALTHLEYFYTSDYALFEGVLGLAVNMKSLKHLKFKSLRGDKHLLLLHYRNLFETSLLKLETFSLVTNTPQLDYASFFTSFFKMNSLRLVELRVPTITHGLVLAIEKFHNRSFKLNFVLNCTNFTDLPTLDLPNVLIHFEITCNDHIGYKKLISSTTTIHSLLASSSLESFSFLGDKVVLPSIHQWLLSCLNILTKNGNVKSLNISFKSDTLPISDTNDDKTIYSKWIEDVYLIMDPLRHLKRTMTVNGFELQAFNEFFWNRDGLLEKLVGSEKERTTMKFYWFHPDPDAF